MTQWHAPDLHQAQALEARIHTLAKDDDPDVSKFYALIKEGWTPFLSDYLTRRRQKNLTSVDYEPHFHSHSRSSKLFEILLSAFPILLDSLNVCDGKTTTFYDFSKTPWSFLGTQQREFLIQNHSHLLHPIPLSHDQDHSWLSSMVVALLPPYVFSGSPRFSEPLPDLPFYGYFESRAWIQLQASQPSLAAVLSGTLCALVCLDDTLRPWGALASKNASLCAPVTEPSTYYRIIIGEALISTLIEDNPQTLSWLLSFNSHLLQHSELNVFSQYLPASQRLKDVNLENSKPFRSLKLTSTNIQDFFIPSKSKNPYPIISNKNGSFFPKNMTYNTFDVMPLFSLAAHFNAEKSWPILEKHLGSPCSVETILISQTQLPSLIELEQRFQRHLHAALASHPSSAQRLESNLKKEKSRAYRLLNKLPFSRELVEALAGPGSFTSWGPEAVMTYNQFSPHALDLFHQSCQKALTKIKASRPAIIELPVLFTWSSMLLNSGIKPSFLQKVTPVGTLSRAASFYDHVYLLGARSRFNDQEYSVIENDDLALNLSQHTQPSTFSSAKIRL